MEMKTQDNIAMDAEDVRRLHEAIEKGDIEVVRSLLQGQAKVLGMNNGLERLLFRKIRSRHCFIYFDGFDEIPSKYRSSAETLLSTLRNITPMKIMVTIRKHHQEELENLLGACSYNLVPFSADDQVGYLDRFWKFQLKNPNANRDPEKDLPQKMKILIGEMRKRNRNAELSQLILRLESIDLKGSMEIIRKEIDKLNLTVLARSILKKTFVDKEMLEFIGIPLHSFMIGVIYFNNNFNLDIQTDLYSLYFHFIERKLLIYLEDKQGIRIDGRVKEDAMKKVREDSYRIHSALAKKLVDEEKLFLSSDLSKNDYELSCDLGIVSSMLIEYNSSTVHLQNFLGLQISKRR